MRRTGLAGHGRPRFVAPVAKPPDLPMPSKPSPEMATAETASEAEEAFTGVIRPDQPASMAGEAADLPPEETDHGEATAEQGHATPVAEGAGRN